MGFGQKPSCGKSKILLGIGVFLGLRLVESALTSVALFGANQDFPDTWKAFLHESGLLSAQLVLLTIILYHVLLGVIYCVVTHRMLSPAPKSRIIAMQAVFLFWETACFFIDWEEFFFWCANGKKHVIITSRALCFRITGGFRRLKTKSPLCSLENILP